MDIAAVLSSLIVVLVAAKIAAELAERVGAPAVVGEIVAGVLVGPSALGLIGHHNEILQALGELGVILLLLEVGMEMDLAELTKVGRASFLVAVVGVVVPMVLGFGAMELFLNTDFNTSLFVGAALTATSVGITARVFGDLKALATTEARVVLGAAVADDVMGLVVLTVVVRLVTEGSVSALSVLGIIGVALLFLGVGAVLGLRIADPIFNAVNKVSRSTGTMVALAFAFALGFARVAAAAKLAPIVGAFVAGLALTRSRQSDQIRRELAPVGHLLIPVFFLQIGVEADLRAFASTAVLRDAAILLAVAAIGKLASPIGAFGTKTDKMLIGLGMLPRGEVGLIFATLGKSAGVLSDDLYASLLLVVLVTTVVTPQLLKLRYSQIDQSDIAIDETGEPEPAGGWLREEGGVVELAARPPASVAAAIAFQAALQVAYREPGPELSTWLSNVPDAALRWRTELYDALLDAAERGTARSWRFLDVTGTLEAMLPTLHAAFVRRRDDGRAVDPLARYRLAGLEQLRRLDADDPISLEARQMLHPDCLLLALLLVDALDRTPSAAGAAAAFCDEMMLAGDARDVVVGLITDHELFWAAAQRARAFAEENVLSLAAHFKTPERARGSYVVSMLRNAEAERWQLDRVRELYRLIGDSLATADSVGPEASDVIARQRDEALAVVDDAAQRERIVAAPRSYLLRESTAAIVRQSEVVTRPFGDNEVRVRVTPRGARQWAIDVAARDRRGLLADITGVLAAHGLSVTEAVIATWPDGIALESFRVKGRKAPDAPALERDILAAFDAALESAPLPEAVVAFDQHASPWHTACEVAARDRTALLHTIAAAFTAAGVEVVAATITVDKNTVYDRFELVGSNGHKLTAEQEADVRRYLAGGVITTKRWFRERYRVATN